MASLIDVDQEVGSSLGKWLLFSNPDSTRGRQRITIKASPDRGLTWPKEHRLLLDEGRSAGYSCMSMIDEKTIGILYEGSQAQMTFQRISLKDLTGKADAPSGPVPKVSRQSLKLPNILLIVSEDNSEHLGCYGEQRVHTPHLDALAEGVRVVRSAGGSSRVEKSGGQCGASRHPTATAQSHARLSHEIKDPFASKANITTFIAEQKEYLHKQYKAAGFRWPHLAMFEMAQ